MARFTVRIELRNAQNGNYEALNRAMEAQGFTRVIKVQDGRRYHLPTAEYRIAGRRTRAQICRLAQAGVADTDSDDAAILVTEGMCSWHNLRGSPK